MDFDQAAEKLDAVFAEMWASDEAQTLYVIAGALVVVMEHAAEADGKDPNATMLIKSEGGRDITIHKRAGS